MTSSPSSSTNAGTPKRRHGCLIQLLGLAALGAVIGLGIPALLAPWSFFLGGHFHALPVWYGWGRLQAHSGNYVIYVQLEPSFRGSRMYRHSLIDGTARLCSPRGEEFPLKLSGDMRPGVSTNLEGEKINFTANYWPPGTGGFITNRAPRFAVRGVWHSTDIVGDDDGSISNSFNADGSVYREHVAGRPYRAEVVPVTIHEGDYSGFKAACHAPAGSRSEAGTGA
jgi:hypothetical protein